MLQEHPLLGEDVTNTVLQTLVGGIHRLKGWVIFFIPRVFKYIICFVLSFSTQINLFGIYCQAYPWGFDIRNWLRHLNPWTWPETLRQFALSGGFGPQLKKHNIEQVHPCNNNEVFFFFFHSTITHPNIYIQLI